MTRSQIRHRDGPAVRKALDAAEEVFARRGFSAATVDEIATRAAMAKSHVYYHFKGKRQILDRLIEVRLAEILAQKDELIAGLTELTPEAVATLARRIIHGLFVPRARFLRVVLLEAFTAGNQELPHLLQQLLGPLVQDELKRYEVAGFSFDRERFASDHIHFGLLPVLMHIAFGDALAPASHTSRERALDLVVDRAIEVQLETMRRMTPSALSLPTTQRVPRKKTP